MSVTMSRILSAFTLFALVACVSAGTLYSDTDRNGVATIGSVAAGAGCASETFLGGASEVNVSWTNFTMDADTLSFKLCFTTERISERPWRKFKDEIDKNKQCWQTAKLEKFLKEGVTYEEAGSMMIEIPENTAPSMYTVQVLGVKDGMYTVRRCKLKPCRHPC